MRRNGAIGSWDGETGSGVCVRDMQAPDMFGVDTCSNIQTNWPDWLPVSVCPWQ